MDVRRSGSLFGVRIFGVEHLGVLISAAVLSASFAACKSGTFIDNTDGGGGVCNAATSRCQDSAVQTCKLTAEGTLSWQQTEVCQPGTQRCVEFNGQASCVNNPTCTDGVKNQDETDVDCGGTHCDKCSFNKTCKGDSDCQSAACESGMCRACKAQTASCLGNLVRICKTDQSGWSTIATCDPATGQVCDITTKSCKVSRPLGSPKVTGTYYLFAMFKTGTVFKGGYDVDSIANVVADSKNNLIYVNRMSKLDVYRVELLDSDNDGKLEPNQHPKNPKHTGPIEQRKLTFVKTYPNVKLGQPSVAEIFAAKDRIFFINRNRTTRAPDIFEFVFSTGATNLVIKGNPKVPLAVLGYDDVNDHWYGGYNSSVRRVYSYYPKANGWAVEFDYPNLAGSHMDGMEVVIDPKTKVPYVYVSDMTSDFLAQYYRDPTTKQWVQKNVFKYEETEKQAVEGMGFGAFQHFWATSGRALYEVGGGDLQKYVGIK